MGGHRSLRTRVIVLLVLVSTLPVVFLGACGFWVARREAAERELSSLAAQNWDLKAYVDKYLASNTQLVQFVAEARELREFMESSSHAPAQVASMNQWLEYQKSLAPDLMAVFLMDSKGACLASSQVAWVGDCYAFRDYFKDAMSGRVRLTDLCIGLSDKQPCLFIAAPVKRGEQTLGVVALKISVERIQAMVKNATLGRKYVFLLNPDGIVLMHSKPEHEFHALKPLSEDRIKALNESRQFAGKEIGNLEIGPSFQTALARMHALGSQNAWVRYTFAGNPRLAVLSMLTEEPWVLAVAVDESSIYARSFSLLVGTAVIAGLTLVLVLGGGLFFARKVLNPLKHLAQTMDRFGQGDGTARANIDSEDEVARLGESFNAMADTIEAQRKELETKVDQLEGILPICASCKKIRNDAGEYEPIERYISSRTTAQFSHGLCEDCARKLYPEVFEQRK